MPPEELFGRSAMDFYCGADLEFLEQKRLGDRASDRYEFHLPRVDGKPMPVIISARRITSPDGIRFAVITFTDITEQKDAEKSLRKANRRLEDHQKQIQTELMLAARVQQSLVPRALVWGNVTVETHYAPGHSCGYNFGLVSV